jgi:hypothetical protein
LTPIVTDEVKNHLAAKLGATKGLEFIFHHATADKEHAFKIRTLINDVARLYPDKIESIAYGFEYFATAYPLPCWLGALRRADRVATRRHEKLSAEAAE